MATLLLTHRYQGEFYVSSSTETKVEMGKSSTQLNSHEERTTGKGTRRGVEDGRGRPAEKKGVGSLNTDEAAV